jgi:hypothetical protein
MINRLCSGTEDRDDQRVSLADSFCEWIIEGTTNERPLLERLVKVAHVTFTTDFAAHKSRKRWLVNGAHLALALIARADNKPFMSQAAAEPGRTSWIERLQVTLATPLSWLHSDLHDPSYGHQHIASWIRDEKDQTARPLRRLKRGDLMPFMQDFHAKIGEPLQAYLERTGNQAATDEVTQTFDALANSLLDIAKYEDYEQFKKGDITLSREADEACLESYRELLKLVFSPEEQRVRELSRMFISHRRRQTGV